MSDSSIVLKESQAIIDAETLLKTPVEELTDDAKLTAWSVLDLFKKEFLDSRHKEIGMSLKELAKKDGVENAKGSFKYTVPNTDGIIEARKKRGKVTIDECKLDLLMAKKLNQGLITQEDVVFKLVRVVDEEAIERLVARGIVTPKELEEISSIGESTFSLYVTKPSAVTKLLRSKNAK